MGGKNAKNSMSFDRKIEVAEFAGTVYSIFQQKELNISIFCIVLFLIILFLFIKVRDTYKGIRFYYSKYQKYLRILEKAISEDALDISEYGYVKDKIRDNCWRKCIRNIKKNGITLFVSIAACFTVCICNPQNVQACEAGIKVILNSEDKRMDVEEREDDSISSSQTALEDEVEESHRNTSWRFVLDDKSREFEIEHERLCKVFFSDNAQNLSMEYMFEEIENELKIHKDGVDYRIIKDEIGNGFSTYLKMQENFEKEIDDAAEYETETEWMENAPHSASLDEYINGREQLNKINIEGKSGCYILWWYLANDYQNYALEYEHQTNNSQAILYYYVNSIYCCMMALQYINDENVYNDVYHYMVKRYHDICQDSLPINPIYKKRAKAIYKKLLENDKLI